MSSFSQFSAVPLRFPPSDWNPRVEGQNRAKARGAALTEGYTEFNARCASHSYTLFDVATGACLICLNENLNLPDRIRYERAYADAYPAQCEVHGEALHFMASNKCMECFDKVGRRRGTKGRPGNPVRVAARKSGASSYIATCTIHGDVPHHTIRGKCLKCFNSLGYPRKAQPPG